MADIITLKSKFLRNVFDQNTYVLLNGNDAVVIDAGADVEDVAKAVKGKKLQAVLLTHIHIDHIWNLEQYVENFGCDVYVCAGEEHRFVDINLNASFVVRQQITKNIDQKFIKYYAKKLKIGSFNFEIFFTPGHTSDGVCILWNKDLFTGDTVFVDGIGRTDLPDSNAFEMVNSLKQILNIDFSEAFPGHYEPANKEKINKTINYYL